MTKRNRKPQPRKLNLAEVAGLTAAYGEVQAAERQLQQAGDAFHRLQNSIGLNPQLKYRIEEDGTVVELEQ